MNEFLSDLLEYPMSHHIYLSLTNIAFLFSLSISNLFVIIYSLSIKTSIS